MANVLGGQEHLTRTLLISTRNSAQVLLPTKDEARAFLEPYRIGNARLNDWLKLTDQPETFPDDFDDLPDVPRSVWSEDEFDRAVQGAITALKRFSTDSTLPLFDDLRIAAVLLGKPHPERAMRLVKAALAQRPMSKVMWAMQAELEAYIASGCQTELTDFTDAED